MFAYRLMVVLPPNDKFFYWEAWYHSSAISINFNADDGIGHFCSQNRPIAHNDFSFYDVLSPNMSLMQMFTLTFSNSIAVSIRIVTCLNMPIFVVFVVYALGHVTRGFLELFW